METKNEPIKNSIEFYDQKRQFYLKGALIATIPFFIIWLVRFILRQIGILPQSVENILNLLLILTLPFQAYFSIQLAKLRQTVHKDQTLHSALNNELVIANEGKASRWALLSMTGCLVFLALLSIITPIQDMVGVAISAILAGYTGYMASFYFLDRRQYG